MMYLQQSNGKFPIMYSYRSYFRFWLNRLKRDSTDLDKREHTKMTRHSKNATANAVYTFYEKQADSSKGQYGVQRLRIGKDSLQEFNCCCLSMHPCVDPVVTPEGCLYEREAILQYLLDKKTEFKRKLKQYKLQLKTRKRKQINDDLSRKRTCLQNATAISNMEGDNAVNLPSFWVPSLTPAANEEYLTEPLEETEICCPVTGNYLSFRDLIPVKFTFAGEVNKKSSAALMKAARKGAYICPVTGDSLSSSIEMVVLKPSGHVVTMKVVKRIIQNENKCPLTGVTLADNDLITLRRVGTGFTAGGGDLKSEKHNPSMD